ncbi:MAG TPA: hypothetical protein VGX76_11050, partial [Pirellulales bacterium]|nr:hypothetical protein [Pirellulales bacterium]
RPLRSGGRGGCKSPSLAQPFRFIFATDKLTRKVKLWGGRATRGHHFVAIGRPSAMARLSWGR